MQIRIFSGVVLAMLVVGVPDARAGESCGVYDLVDDWSDVANPNGVWTYGEGPNALPQVEDFESELGTWGEPQPAWSHSENGTDRIPAWLRSNGSETFERDFVAGDVVVHAQDDTNGVGNSPARLVWTAPFDGFVSVGGSVWMGREIGRSASWTLYLDSTALTGGSVASGDPYSREDPFDFSEGSGGPAVLSGIPVKTGDKLRLVVVRTSTFGDHVGVRMTVTCDSFATTTTLPAGDCIVDDVTRDWSDEANPNGPWSYQEGPDLLPAVEGWQRNLGGWEELQPGWAYSEDGNNRTPFWFRSNGDEDFPHDFRTRDVVVHTPDANSGTGNGPARLVWTAGFDGVVSIDGAVWMGRDIGRSAKWTLFRDSTPLTGGDIASGDQYSRDDPFDFSEGSGGPGAISGLEVRQGDELRLVLDRTSQFGDLVGLQMAVSCDELSPTTTTTLPPNGCGVFDLAGQWSDGENPNGPWTYREGGNALPAVEGWQRNSGGWEKLQPGWAESEDGNNRTPFWFRSNGDEDFVHDYLTRDVVVHTSDNASGSGNGAAEIAWTSPFDGAVTVDGAVWMAREIGRSANWALFHETTQLSAGNVASGDPYSRASPFEFASGSGGATALDGIEVQQGDEVRLVVSRTSEFGDLVGVRMKIACESVVTTTTLPDQNCGDTNGSGGITAPDALFVLRSSVGQFACAPCVCDANGNGSVTAPDALLVLRAAVGQLVVLNCPPC